MGTPNSISVNVKSGRSVVISAKTTQPVLVNQSNLVSRSLNDLIDVDTSNKTDGSLLIYNESQGKLVASTILEKQTLNGGNF